jgi:hypothetical protein
MNLKTLHGKGLYATVFFLASVFLTLTSVKPAWSDYGQMRDEISQFHAFMRDHPKVATDLQANPLLVNDRKYLDKHEDVKKFLRQHPTVQQEIAQRPRRVFGRYYIDDRHEYSDNRPEHRWDYSKARDRRDDREQRDSRDHRDRR